MLVPDKRDDEGEEDDDQFVDGDSTNDDSEDMLDGGEGESVDRDIDGSKSGCEGTVPYNGVGR
jgi:hypothetical protein